MARWTVAIRFGSGEWARALETAINASSEYRLAAATWGVGFNGNVLLAFEGDPIRSESASLLVRLEGGVCRGAEFVDASSHPDAGFALRAPFGLWKDILDRRVPTASAILSGKLKVEGQTMLLLKYAAAHRALVACASVIDTEF